MQDEVTMYRFMIAPLKEWKSSNMWEKPKHLKILLRKKLRDDGSQ
jgi:hypothetical protein